MAGTKLNPEKITSPFQLMAAWFSMLILLTSVLLTAANNIARPDWAAGFLVVFASIVVVMVLVCVTLMLTVFRPHLQEGKEYAQWLRDKNTYSAGLLVREQPSPSSRPRIRSQQRASALEHGVFPVHVNAALAGAADVVRALRKARLNADVHRETYEPEDKADVPEKQQAIWVGHRVPANEAVRAIKVASEKWPHLKYIHLSNDGGAPPDEVHSEIYIGGSSSAAEEYGLIPWSPEEFAGLAEDMTREAFHHAIRDKYT